MLGLSGLRETGPGADGQAQRVRSRGAARRWLRSVSVLLLCGVGGASWAARPYRGGVVATAHPYASEAALSMLERGGNATDAAVAAAFVLGVVAPFHSGLGGGGFAIVFDAKAHATVALDFREVAPAGASRDMFIRDGRHVPELSSDGPLSIAVPGAVKGYLTLLAQHGRLKPEVVLAPAVRLAQRGFWVTPKYHAMARNRVECLRRDPEATRLFLRPNAEGVPDAPPIGERILQPELAATLRAIVRDGARAFYGGRIARAIAATVQAGGGVLTEADLARYEVRWRKPLETSYRGHRVVTMPPPSAGGLTLVQVLGALEAKGPLGLSSRDPEVLHHYVEALRRAFVDRAKYLGDPAFVEVPLQRLSSREYIAQLSASIDPARATASQTLLAGPTSVGTRRPNQADEERKNTTHISVVDRAGNAVALTTTVNDIFGSCVVARGTGVVLNDEMDDFSASPLAPNVAGLVQGEGNTIAPGKIPLSSMTPTIVFAREDPSRVMLVVGSPGGPTIPSTVIQVVSHVVDGGWDVVRAVGAGRIHHQYLPDVVRLDAYALEPMTRQVLEAKGHTLDTSGVWGDPQAVFVDPVTGLRFAGSDMRNEGAAMGQD